MISKENFGIDSWRLERVNLVILVAKSFNIVKSCTAGYPQLGTVELPRLTKHTNLLVLASVSNVVTSV